MKKKIFIIIGVIIAVIVLGIAYMMVSDLKQEKKLKEEMEYIDELVNKEDFDSSEVNSILARNVTKNDYQVVEKAYKSYLKDSFDIIVNIKNILDDERLTENLSFENYKKDGPDFIETKKYLTETKTKLEEYKLKYTELFNQENVMSYINDKGLDTYYIDLYKNEIVGDIEKEKNDKTVENSLNDVIDVLNTTEEIIDFLIKNKGKWSLKNDGIVFDSDSLLNEYETLVSKL